MNRSRYTILLVCVCFGIAAVSSDIGVMFGNKTVL